jgi:adenosylcobinamide-phosphate synthase
LNERYGEFGWAAAKLDDVLNWIPARLTAALICLVYRSRSAWETVTEDADLHRSPNAGWPEAAMAGVLGIALSGPRSYSGEMTRDSYVNASGRRVLLGGDIDRAVDVLWRAWAAVVAVLALISMVIVLLF